MDIALQEYGSVAFVFEIVRDNKLNGVTDNVYEGDRLLITGGAGNLRIKTFLEGYEIATLDDEARAAGIGFWEINKTFIVQ